MATIPLPTGQVGIYEQPVTANTVWTIQVALTYQFVGELLEVTNYGTGLLYLRRGPTVAVKDPMAYVVNPSEVIEIDVRPDSGMLSMISATDTSVSVARAQ